MRTRWLHLAPIVPLALAAGLSAACGPPPTGSATVSNGTLLFTAAPGKANNVVVTTNGSAVVLADGGDEVTAGDGCTQDGDRRVVCPGVAKLRLTLADGDDRALNGTRLPTDSTGIRGGPGNDVIIGGELGELLVGDEGTDELRGGGGSDALSDGFSAGSTDVVDADLFDGGDGVDTASYSAGARAVTIDLDGVADDGQPGEGDTLTASVEGATGGNGPDVLTGDGRANRLGGDEGNDVIQGLGGNDTLFGSKGADALDGGADSDTCHRGGGNGDSDAGDTTRNCESTP